MRELGLDAPALVFNGSAIYCPREDRLIERLVLHDALVAQLHALALQRDMLFVIEHGDERYARSPRDAGEAALLDWISNIPGLVSQARRAHGQLLSLSACASHIATLKEESGMTLEKAATSDALGSLIRPPRRRSAAPRGGYRSGQRQSSFRGYAP